MEILVYMAVWRRPEITELCFRSLKKLGLNAFVVYSEDWVKPMLDKYGFSGVWHENRPLGRKKNFGLKEALKLKWDYLLELGSDDILRPDFMKFYKPYFDKGVEYFGINQCYLIEPSTKRVARFKNGYIIGGGRCFKRDVFEGLGNNVSFQFKNGKTVLMPERYGKRFKKLGKIIERFEVDFRLWGDGCEIALDGNSDLYLQSNGFKGEVIDECLLLDIKSEDNLHSMDEFERLGYITDDNYEKICKRYVGRLI